MRQFLQTTIFSLMGIGLSFFTLEAEANQELKNNMVADLEVIKHVLEVRYAPKQWKQTYLGWNLDEQIAQAKVQVLTNDPISVKSFQQIVRQFLKSTRDYHVNVIFLSTESASLPFTVKGVNGRYFINWIDNNRLSTSFALSIGDELLQFDGRPVDQVVQELRNSAARSSNPLTDEALAQINLSFRNGQRGDIIPRGPVKIQVRSNESGQIRSYQLMWNYFPEYITQPKNGAWFTGSIDPIMDLFKEKKGITAKSMWNPVADLYVNKEWKGSKGLGSYKSFVPLLGQPSWVPEEDLPFNAYIYTNKQNKQIGYVRIPNYRGWEKEALLFGGLMQYFQENTDALVIDQVDNPGGVVQYLYSLLSYLTDEPLSIPKHRISINQEDLLEAYMVKSLLSQVNNDEDAEEFFSGNSLIRSHQHALFLKEYYQFIIDEWEAGRILTEPTYIEGIDLINPQSQSYKKPILVLINQLDFSGGDFFPAILQDNGRAKLFGSGTAGAGGYVSLFNFPNRHGIAGFSYTASIAERKNQLPIENLAVQPDIAYAVTEDDLQHEYQSYADAVNEAIDQLLTPIKPTMDSTSNTAELTNKVEIEQTNQQ